MINNLLFYHDSLSFIVFGCWNGTRVNIFLGGKSLGEMKMGLPWLVLTCLLPVWMRSWVFNLWACVKDLPQVWHAKGLSPEWINWKKGMQINDYWVVPR